MKVSLNWLKELVDYNLSPQELADQISLKSIGVKEVTGDFLELDLTYNRGDLLSLRGVAYEVSAVTGAPLKLMSLAHEDFVWVGKDLPQVKVEVEDEKLVSVYCIAKIENVKVEQSNETWVKRLSDSGQRSVNNIADVTNLIMLEYGQPMHAFDARQVKDETFVVRGAKKGEKLTTLDSKTRILDTSDLLIADSSKPLGLAGVMGGKESEISDSTTTILLEAAIFDPLSIRKTSKKFGLYSEASKRFQHGLSQMRLLQALDGAIKMYQELGGKLTAVNLVGDFNQSKKSINLSIKKTNSLLGIKLDEETIVDCLEKLNFTSRKIDKDTLEVIPPYFRLDINIEEDLIEEVARIYGYEKIEAKPLDGEEPQKLDQSLQERIQSLKEGCKDAGLTEVQTYSFLSTKVQEALGFNKENSQLAVAVANPISKETEILRTFIWFNLMEVVAKNIKAGEKDIAIFEIGKVYNPGPKESYRLAIALMNNSDNPVEELISIVREIKSLKVELKTGGMMKELETLFHSKRYVNIEKDGKTIGGLAEVHPRFLNKIGIGKRVAILEISLPQ